MIKIYEVPDSALTNLEAFDAFLPSISVDHEEEKTAPIINPETGTIYSCTELHIAFTTVEDSSNWKNSILTSIAESDRDIVKEAIIFFTGSTPKFFEVGNGRLVVRANGYYSR